MFAIGHELAKSDNERRGDIRLVPLGAIRNEVNRNPNYEVNLQERISKSWILVVGPVLVNQTRLLRIHRGTLLIGCWNSAIISSLRQSVEVIWPQLKLRLEQLWKLKILRMEIVPCDPLESKSNLPIIRSKDSIDPFEEVLKLLRDQNVDVNINKL